MFVYQNMANCQKFHMIQPNNNKFRRNHNMDAIYRTITLCRKQSKWRRITRTRPWDTLTLTDQKNEKEIAKGDLEGVTENKGEK